MDFISFEMLIWQASLISIYWLLPRAAQLHWVSALTAAFLLVNAPTSLMFLGAITLLCFYLGQKRAGFAIVICVLLIIGYRIASSGNPMQTVEFRSIDSQGVQNLILIGFSYYILRAIHYLIEQVKGGFERHDLALFFNYMFFLPTLFIGPINRFDDFIRDNRRRRWDSDQFTAGFIRIIYGYTKVVVIAYYLINRKFVRWMADLDPDNTWLLEYLDCWYYALNLYFQFSGYTDIAIGTGALLGFRINENFNYPFLRKNISDFWRSWHMSLTSWSRDYVYPSVAAATRSPYIAIFISMVFIGIWHEFSPKYLIWGFYHGAGIILHRLYQRLWSNTALPGFFGAEKLLNMFYTLLTLHFVVLGFILVKEDSLSESLRSLQILLGL